MKKDFLKYFNKVEEQYLEMKQNLTDMEESLRDGLVSPEMFDQLKEMVRPLKNNYETLSYVKFLLDMPKDANKLPSYEIKNQKLLEQSKTNKEVIEENTAVLNELEKYIQ